MRLEKITPNKAREYLAKNTKNRGLNVSSIDRLANVIRRGEWELNGETIKFDKTGRLIDGQHRLNAIVQSGIPVETYVVDGLGSNVFDTIDTGKGRSGADILSIEGFKHTSTLASIARLHYVAQTFGSIEKLTSRRMEKLSTPRDILEIVQKNPEMQKSADFIKSYAAFRRLASPATIAYAHWLITQVSPLNGDVFFQRLGDGSGLAPDSPILILRERLAQIISGTRQDRLEILALIIKAWNAYVTGKPIKQIRYARTEDFPLIVVPGKLKAKHVG